MKYWGLVKAYDLYIAQAEDWISNIAHIKVFGYEKNRYPENPIYLNLPHVFNYVRVIPDFDYSYIKIINAAALSDLEVLTSYFVSGTRSINYAL